MKVTLICAEWPGAGHVGGAARYAFRLAQDLSRLVELTVVTITDGIPLPNARMIYLDPGAGRFSRYYVLPFRIRRSLKRISSDIVHSFGEDWALDQDGSAVVRTFHGRSWSEAMSSTGLRRLNHLALAVLEKVSQWRADVRIAIGPESMDAFGCHHLMPPIVPIDAEPVTKAHDPRVIFIGSYASRKRGYLVEKAVESASRSLGREVELVVVGPESDRDRWRDETRHVSGATDDEVHRLIQESWVLMAPSSYEGFGIPAFEALSLGVAALCSSNPGSGYLGSVFGTEGVFTIATDEELAPALVRRLSRGGTLDPEEAESARSGVSAMLRLSSAQHLVDRIYSPAVRERSLRRGR